MIIGVIAARLGSGSGNVVTGNGSTGADINGVPISLPIGSTVRSGSIGSGSADATTSFLANSPRSAAGVVRTVGGRPTLAGSGAATVGPDNRIGDLGLISFG